MHLPIRVHDFGFRHPIDRSAFLYESADLRSQRSADVDWATCDTDDRWYCYTFDSGSLHDVTTSVVEKSQRDASDNLIT